MLGQIVNTLRSVVGPSRTSSTPQSKPYARPAIESLEERSLLSLTPVAPGSAFPFTSIVKIEATFADGQTVVGTGSMVDSFQVLTAGHVIYRAADRGWATSVKVMPEEYVGADGRLVEPFGYALAQRGGLHTFTTFINSDRAHPGQFAYGDEDVGLISLDRNIGARTGWMNFGYFNSGSYKAGTVMDTGGYPTLGAPSYDGYHMEFGAGPIAGMSRDGSAINYYQSSMPTYKGQSGSPMWEKQADGSRLIVGVVSAGNGTANGLNAATAITPTIYKGLLQMMASDHKPIGDPISVDPQSYVRPTSPGGTTGGTVYTFMSAEIGANGPQAEPSLHPSPAAVTVPTASAKAIAVNDFAHVNADADCDSREMVAHKTPADLPMLFDLELQDLWASKRK